MPPEVFLEIGSEINGRIGASDAVQLESYITNFGTYPAIHSRLWTMIVEQTDIITKFPKLHPKHLLWSFTTLKKYQKEDGSCSSVSTTKDDAPCGRSFRDHSWEVIAAIDALAEDVVSIGLSCALRSISATLTNAFASLSQFLYASLCRYILDGSTDAMVLAPTRRRYLLMPPTSERRKSGLSIQEIIRTSLTVLGRGLKFV